jgi:hypothetical protein
MENQNTLEKKPKSFLVRTDEGLLEELKTISEHEHRSLNKQIVWLLKKAVKSEIKKFGST